MRERGVRERGVRERDGRESQRTESVSCPVRVYVSVSHLWRSTSLVHGTVPSPRSELTSMVTVVSSGSKSPARRSASSCTQNGGKCTREARQDVRRDVGEMAGRVSGEMHWRYKQGDQARCSEQLLACTCSNSAFSGRARKAEPIARVATSSKARRDAAETHCCTWWLVARAKKIVASKTK